MEERRLGRVGRLTLTWYFEFGLEFIFRGGKGFFLVEVNSKLILGGKLKGVSSYLLIIFAVVPPGVFENCLEKRDIPVVGELDLDSLFSVEEPVCFVFQSNGIWALLGWITLYHRIRNMETIQDLFGIFRNHRNEIIKTKIQL